MTNTANTVSWVDMLADWVNKIDSLVWGLPLVCAILATGVILTIALRLGHVFNIKSAFHYLLHSDKGAKGDISAFGALCTALSATIGTGNIVGVATAIGTGGPGALLWMEVAAFFGMATKYAEGLLAVKYRTFTPDGRVLGGPFYYIERGMGRKWRPLAVAFAAFGLIAGLCGIGTIAQIHGITSAIQRFFAPDFNAATSTGVTIMGMNQPLCVLISGTFVTTCVALVIIGGLRRIAKVSMIVVPFMAIFYVAFVTLLLFANLSRIPEAVELIVKAAFNPAAFAGGATGSIIIAIQTGVARGIFSNEAGLGSEPIAAATAKTDEPARQGLVSMVGVFVDTIVICTMTGLAIVVTGAWDPALGLKGVDITIEAFSRGLSFLGPKSALISSMFLMVALAFFAFTTILGWNYYAERCLEYLIGPEKKGVIRTFRLLYVAVVFIGPFLTVSIVWGIADIFNGLMALPNLIALIALSPVVYKVSKEFFDKTSRRD